MPTLVYETMIKLTAYVHSVHTGSNNNLGTIEEEVIELEFDGIVNDPHRGYTREAWAGDKQKKGTIRRNERQWSAVSIEEINEIEDAMNGNICRCGTYTRIKKAIKNAASSSNA